MFSDECACIMFYLGVFFIRVQFVCAYVYTYYSTNTFMLVNIWYSSSLYTFCVCMCSYVHVCVCAHALCYQHLYVI